MTADDEKPLNLPERGNVRAVIQQRGPREWHSWIEDGMCSGDISISWTERAARRKAKRALRKWIARSWRGPLVVVATEQYGQSRPEPQPIPPNGFKH